MFKPIENVRFPESEDLFRFCFSVMEQRRKNECIHDQELGDILEFNPSDTSHWKHGKKSLQNIFYLIKLSNALDINYELLQDLILKKTTLDEATFEFEITELEKKLFGNHTQISHELAQNIQSLEKAAQLIIEEAKILSVPVYIPELMSLFPQVQLQCYDIQDKLARCLKLKPKKFSIRHKKESNRAHVRMAICFELANLILTVERERFGLAAANSNISIKAESLLLTSMLLLPRSLFVSEFVKLSSKTNLIDTVAEQFWVPRFLARQRLRYLGFEGLGLTQATPSLPQIEAN